MTQDLEFQRADGLTIRGKLYIPGKEKGRKPYPLAVFAHGMGGNGHCLAEQGLMLAEAGICTFLFDFCGGGADSFSDGAMQDMTIRTECADLRTVLEGLWELPDLDRNNTYLMGESLGGLVAALTAARLHSRIKGLILWYPAFNMPSRIRKAFPAMQSEARRFFGIDLGTGFYKEGKDIDAYAAAESYAGPVLLIHGDADSIVPLACSEKAMDTYENAQLIIVPGGVHGFGGADRLRAVESTAVFIKEHAMEKL